MIEIQAATLMWSAPCQNSMTMEAAEISAQRVIADAYQFYSNHGNQYWSVLVARKVQNASLRRCGALGWRGGGPRNRKITHIPPNGKPKCIIDVTGTELGNGTG